MIDYTTFTIRVTVLQKNFDDNPDALERSSDEIKYELENMFKIKSDTTPFTFKVTEDFPE